MYKTRIKEKWWFSQCGRTWLVCRKQLNTSGVTLNEPQTHHQTPMTCTYGYSHFIHTKTVATEVEIQFLSTWIMFPSLLPQFGSAFFSSKEGVCQYFCPYNECTRIHYILLFLASKEWSWSREQYTSHVKMFTWSIHQQLLLYPSLICCHKCGFKCVKYEQ